MAITEREITTGDGARIAYDVNGDGPPILTLHGVLVGTSNWIHQMLRLPRFHWIAPALRGHGRSSPAGNQPSIEQAAFDAVAVLDAEGVDRAVAVGNSLGATVGLALALLRPRWVQALILVEPVLPALLPEGGGDRLGAAARQARIHLAEGRVDDALDLFLTPRIGPDWRNKVGRRRLAEWRHNVRSTPAWYDALDAFDPDPGPLAALDLPTLLVYGARTQPVYREMVQAAAGAIPAAAVIEVPDAGHGAPADNPEAFNALLIDFLHCMGIRAG
jgi:pimeloyl-ACP methyl ester carboxylesterase